MILYVKQNTYLFIYLFIYLLLLLLLCEMSDK